MTSAKIQFKYAVHPNKRKVERWFKLNLLDNDPITLAYANHRIDLPNYSVVLPVACLFSSQQDSSLASVLKKEPAIKSLTPLCRPASVPAGILQAAHPQTTTPCSFANFNWK